MKLYHYTSIEAFKKIWESKSLKFSVSKTTNDYFERVTPCLALCDVMIVNMREQICLLTEARDRLLPKLMSGEIAV